MNYEVAIGMQRICTGETAELTRGGIAEEVIDINKIIEGMNEENAGKCRAFYDKICRQCQEGSSEDDPSLSANLKDMIAGCCIVAVSAIRDQDDFALDMVQSRAAQKGHAISEDYENGKYEEGGSVFTDNVMRLYRFICGFLEI